MRVIGIAALVVGSLALAQLVVLCQAENNRQELCGDGKIELQSIDDLYRTSTSGCDERVEVAFEALKEMVRERNVCTMAKATKIVGFFEDHVKGSDWQASESKAQTLIEKFAVAYGIQANNCCRYLMEQEFYRIASESLTDSDFEALKEWTRDDSPIARLLGSITRDGDFLLPSDFSTLAQDVVDKLKVRMTENSDKIRYAQEVCRKRFRPLYEHVVMPIAYLARNGLDYNLVTYEIPFSSQTGTRRQNKLWSRIVFVCESLKDIEVIEAPTGNHVAGAHENPGLVKSTAGLKMLGHFEPYAMINGKKEDGGRSVKEAERFQLYSSAKFRLRSAMESFNVTMSETDRLRKRVLGNKWGLLIATFKSNEQMRPLLKKAYEMTVAAWQTESHADQDQELDLAKKQLLGLVEAEKNSTTFYILAKILKGGKKLIWALGLLLEIVFFLTVAVGWTATSVVDLVAGVVNLKPRLTSKFFDVLFGI